MKSSASAAGLRMGNMLHISPSLTQYDFSFYSFFFFPSFFFLECPESQRYLFSDQSGAQLNVPKPTPHRTNKRRLSLPWSRPVFTYHQRMTLESRFQLHHYLNRRERYHLSLYLGLTEHQIKIWFQNRRVKFRHRQTAEKQRTNLSRGRASADIK